MKKIRFVFLIALMSVFLTGCVQSASLSNTAIVQGIGIDREGDSFSATLQIYNPDGEGGGIAAMGKNSRTVNSIGSTLSEAISKAVMLQEKKIFYGNNKMIVISEETAKNGLNSINSFFNSDYHSRGNTLTLVSKSSAKDIVALMKNNEIMPSQAVVRMAENSYNEGLMATVYYVDILKNLVNSKGFAYIPAIKIVEKDGELSAVCDGTAIIADEKLKFYLNEYQTRGMLFLLNEIKKTKLAVTDINGLNATVDVMSSNTKINVDIIDGIPVFSVSVNIRGNVSEVTNKKITDKIDEEFLKKIEFSISKEIENMISECIKLTIWENGADIFRFSDLLEKKQFEFYSANKSDILKIVSGSKFNYKINCKIDNLGLSY